MNTAAENGNSISNGASDLSNMDYLRGVESSTCLLLPNTPSPTPLELDFKHPLSEAMSDEPFLSLNGDPNVNMQSSDPSAGDSSSSADSNSVVHDPVSAQLINNISMLDYQTLSKNGDLSSGQPEDIKLNGNLSISNRKLPNFVNWNWELIRKFLLWIVVSALVACLGAIIAMVVTIPKTCNPDLPWYQGKLFYEVFPASFKDSNKDGFGDFKGLINKLDYINELGVSAIRLNYLFEAEHYPENYENITSMLSVDSRLGGAEQFQDLVAAIHERNMSIVLDLPVVSMVKPHSIKTNFTIPLQFTTDSFVSFDATSSAIMFWSHARYVDGFYLKNLEKYVSDENFGRSLQFWKRIIGHGKILMASEATLRKAEGNALNVLLSRVDLIDVHLNLQQGISGLKKHIENVIDDPLRALPHHPWIHWNIGNVNSNRVSSYNHINNTLALIALEFVLPGTISLFYGDEIGLGMSEETVDSHHKKVQNLVPMTFQHEVNLNHRILPWNSKSTLEPQYHFLEFIKQLSLLRMNTPTLYLQAIYKEEHMLRNAQVRQTEGDLVLLERWYPRRNTCVFAGNLGNQSITTDLSTMFYGGTVVAGTNASLIGTVIYFDKVTFPPNSAIILKLEK